MNLNLNLIVDGPKSSSAFDAHIVPFIHSSFIIFFNIKLTNATMCTIVKQMEQSIYKIQSI